VCAALNRTPDHRLVAKVESIEIAQRKTGAAQSLWDWLVEGQALHVARWLNGNRFQVQTPMASA